MKHLALSLVIATVAVAFAAQSVSVTVAAGKTKNGQAPVTVSISIPAGYHIYGPKSGSVGIPTEVKIKGSDFKIVKASYPKAKPMSQLGEKFEVYEDKVSIPIVVKPTKSLKGVQKVHLLVTSQACNDRTCLPPDTKDLVVSVNFGK